jgi:hypothetical protein
MQAHPYKKTATPEKSSMTHPTADEGTKGYSQPNQNKTTSAHALAIRANDFSILRSPVGGFMMTFSVLCIPKMLNNMNEHLSWEPMANF